MKKLSDIPFSVLDLSPVLEGGTAADSFRSSRELAQHCERCGYHRYWLAEHHSIPGIASAATAVVVGYVAEGTSRIRVGAGGIMLPNHAPLVVAEQFGTLESLYPGRIDLGLGRAPGGDQATARALRRDRTGAVDSFPDDVRELQAFFGPCREGRRVRAIPGEGLEVPLWILGSSDYGARLAAGLGLPYAFAAHFAPDLLLPALEIYRTLFQPSEVLDKPHVMVSVNVFAADDDAEARRLFTSHQQAVLNLVRGKPGLLPPPVAGMDDLWDFAERGQVARMTRFSAVGGPDKVRRTLESVLRETEADELILAGQIYDQEARKRSYEITAGLRDQP